MTDPLNIILVWVGAKYGPEYVDHITDMIGRNISCTERDVRWWCITDKELEDFPESWYGLNGAVYAGVGAPNHIPANPDLPGWWAKLQLFSPDLPFAEGERCFFCDLDNLITGRLEDMVETPGISIDWMTGNLCSTAMVWNHGEHLRVWDSFWAQPWSIRHRVMNMELRGFVQPYGDQDWLTDTEGKEAWTPWPREWVKSYRAHALDWPPEQCKVVSCHGRPKPHEIAEGWVPDLWKIGGLTSLPVMRGMNIAKEKAHDNVRANTRKYTSTPEHTVEHEIGWFSGFGVSDRPICIVAGGPSLRDSIPEIRNQQKRGVRVVTVNNAWRTLVEHNIVPFGNVLVDARPGNLAFVQGVPAGIRHFVASQCDPAVYEALIEQRADIVMWHCYLSEETEEAVRPWDETRPILLVPGGGTVALRTLWMAYFAGYRKIHLYGMDSSYAEDQHHAYAQPMNDGEETMTLRHGGKTYRCARWMARQAEEFQVQYSEMTKMGCTIWVHGSGLIPAIARNMRDQLAA